jgi:hypothetical protein
MDRPILVLPTPGGPAKQMIFPANNQQSRLNTHTITLIHTRTR